MSFIYLLLDPRHGHTSVFYVGVGTRYSRPKAHLRETEQNTTNIHKWRKIAGIREQGLEPVIQIVIDGLTPITAFSYEIRLIEFFGRAGIDPGGCLTNISAGGDVGPVLSGTRNGFFGRKHSDETRQIISAAGKGREFSEEHRRKLSDAARGKPKSPEHSAAIAHALMGMRKPAEHSARMSELHKGKTITPEHRQAISDKLKGRRMSDEHRAKIAQALRNRKKD